jgi:hypothetical protein
LHKIEKANSETGRRRRRKRRNIFVAPNSRYKLFSYLYICQAFVRHGTGPTASVGVLPLYRANIKLANKEGLFNHELLIRSQNIAIPIKLFISFCLAALPDLSE